MYTSAQKVIDAGLDGVWIKVSEEERQALIDSIPGDNLVRGSKQLPSLRHHNCGDYIVIQTRGTDAQTPFPDDPRFKS
jgi:hypothetical protein